MNINRGMRYLIFSLLFLFTMQSAVGKPPKWILAARKLIGYPGDTREKAIKFLRADTQLNEKIEAQFNGKYRYYVLDIIVALGLPEWDRRLLEQVESDSDGFVTLAVNALLTKQNQKKVCGHYLSLLNDKEKRARLSPAAVVAMIDTLGRLGYILEDATVEELAQHTFYEVRQSLISYLRLRSRQNPQKLLKMITKIDDHPYQLRIQMLFAWAELLEPGDMSAVRLCQKDQNTNVRKVCTDLMVIASKVTAK